MTSIHSFFEFIPILVGSIFSAVGVFSLKSFLSLRGSGSKVSGEVTGVEKYVTTMGSGSDRSKAVMYRPVANYTFRGQKREVRGLSVSHLRHHLGQDVEILVRELGESGEVEASIDDSLNIGVGVLFLLVGLGALGMGATLETASTLVIAPTVLAVMIAGFIVDGMIRRVTSAVGPKSQTGGGENCRLITDPKEFDEEVVLHKKAGYAIAFVGLLGGLWILYSGLSGFSPQEFALLTSEPLELLKTEASKKQALIAGIGAFFSLAGLYSIAFQFLQYKFLSRRKAP